MTPFPTTLFSIRIDREDTDISQSLANYYAMMSRGYFGHYAQPFAFELTNQDIDFRANRPKGVVVSRPWTSLRCFDPQWRSRLPSNYEHTGIKGLLADGSLKPTVFSDVDFAILDRDAQGDIDQYVVDRATLESLGFISRFYVELNDSSKHLQEIKGMPDVEKSHELGQALLNKALKNIWRNKKRFIKDKHYKEFKELKNKKRKTLTDEDYQKALSFVKDSFYCLIIDPLTHHLEEAGINPSRVSDPQAGPERMKLIYLTIAAFSHSQIANKTEMLTHNDFSQFDARAHLYRGIEEMFELFRENELGLVAVTRGNQFPFLEESGNHLGSLFDRVYSTLIAAKRSSSDLDPMHPKKRIRPYSMLVDHMTSADKVCIVIHEALEQFKVSGINITNGNELLNAVATYLDHCLFITDSDLEMWDTCPVFATVAIRTPSQTEVAKMFDHGQEIRPVAVADPCELSSERLGLNGVEFFPDFSPEHSGIRDLVAAMSNGEQLKGRRFIKELQPRECTL